MTATNTSSISLRQKILYEAIHSRYEAHYFDSTSLLYRRTFLYPRLLKGLDLNGLRVAELCSSSGFNSLELKTRFPQVRTVGFDISQKAMETYERIVGEPAFELDVTKGTPPEGCGTFDAVMVIGGLHHCVADLPSSFKTISALLKPGGVLFVMEPNADYFLEALRKLWYRNDQLFDAGTERALTLDELSQGLGKNYELQQSCHFGGPAYFFVLNSLIFRIPLWLKPLMVAVTFPLEYIFNLLPGRKMYPIFTANWKKIA